MSQTHSLSRECQVTAIPAGNRVTLPAGTEVFIVQTLGGNITVRTDQGLYRIAAADAVAMASRHDTASRAAWVRPAMRRIERDLVMVRLSVWVCAKQY